MEIKEIEIRKLTVQPNEMLLVQFPRETRHQDIRQFIEKITEKLGHKRILCYIEGNVEFTKVSMEGEGHEATEKDI